MMELHSFMDESLMERTLVIPMNEMDFGNKCAVKEDRLLNCSMK